MRCCIRSFLAASILLVSQAVSAYEVGDTVDFPYASYTLTEQLGAGAFGAVFKVEDEHGNQYALKIAKLDRPKGHPWVDMLADLEREYQRGQQLNHPAIVKSLDYYRDDSDPDQVVEYLLLELLDGKPLHQVAAGEINARQAIDHSIEVLHALRYALEEGFAHLDLHGGNLMISPSRGAVVIDVASFFDDQELKVFGEGYFDSEPQEEASPKKSVSAPKAKAQAVFQKFVARKAKLEEQAKTFKAEAAREAVSGSAHKKSPLESFHPAYVDQMTEIFSRIIWKSDASKQQKLNAKMRLKAIAWEYLLDAQDHTEENVDAYLDALERELPRLLDSE